MQLGVMNTLKVVRERSNGVYLSDGKEDVLLPNKYVPEDLSVDDEIEVFIHRDSEDRLIATTLTPKIFLHEFAALEVKDCTRIGAFLDWGLEKDLLLPRNEQPRRISKGQKVVVYLLIDEQSHRLTASAELQDFVSTEVELEEGDEVSLLAVHQSDLGMQVVVEGKHLGMLFNNEIFQEVLEGDSLRGYVKKVRDDGKLDVSLRKKGYREIDSTQQKLLNKLKANNGILHLTDKSPPDVITKQLQMSKRAFKQSVGALYKQRLIQIKDDCIVLVKD